MKKYIKVMACLMAFIITLAFMPASVYASSGTVKMVAYKEVVKSGNTVYCAGAGGLYKVKLKNGKVKKVTKLDDIQNVFSASSYYYALKKKGNYLYFMITGEGIGGTINRVKVSGGKAKKLATVPLADPTRGYVIKGKKIYYYKFDDVNYSTNLKRVMNLNGKNKAKTSIAAKFTIKNTNSSKYRMVIKKKGSYYKDYLKTPKGSFYLGKAEAIY